MTGEDIERILCAIPEICFIKEFKFIPQNAYKSDSISEVLKPIFQEAESFC